MLQPASPAQKPGILWSATIAGKRSIEIKNAIMGIWMDF
jgi:hypothetical protein